MFTFQDFQNMGSIEKAVKQTIDDHKSSPIYLTALDADLYDHQQNRTINEYTKILYDLMGNPIEDFVASNNKIASNFFHRLNTQRCMYSLGNGVSFTRKEQRTNENGETITVDLTKEQLGYRFDTDLRSVGYFSIIHALSFGYWNSERLYPFPVTEFAPLWDETNGLLRAGVRFWQLDSERPLVAVLYEEDGFTRLQADSENGNLHIVDGKQGYKNIIRSTPFDGVEIVGTFNYSSLPIIPMWGSSLKQSTLIGMRQAIDSYDLIKSGFANDLTDCSQIYWILENYGGMDDSELTKFRDRLKFMHIATADTSNGGKIAGYTQEIPHAAREVYLTMLRNGIYEDFGGLDVHTVAAGATNDHIDAAYQPMDENADDFEFQVIEFIQQILKLEGIEDTPIFKRNRISNQKEQTDMVLAAVDYLDEETVLQKLPFITPDEIPNILARKDVENRERMAEIEEETKTMEEKEEEDE